MSEALRIYLSDPMGYAGGWEQFRSDREDLMPIVQKEINAFDDLPSSSSWQTTEVIVRVGTIHGPLFTVGATVVTIAYTVKFTYWGFDREKSCWRDYIKKIQIVDTLADAIPRI